VTLPGNTFLRALRSATGEHDGLSNRSNRRAQEDVAVVVADIAGEGEYELSGAKFGATPDQLHLLAQWLVQQEVEEVLWIDRAVWKPVWARWSGTGNRRGRSVTGATKMSGTLHLCHAKSNRGAAGAEERLRRRRTDDQAAGGAGTGFELRAGSGTAALANGDAAQSTS